MADYASLSEFIVPSPDRASTDKVYHICGWLRDFNSDSDEGTELSLEFELNGVEDSCSLCRLLENETFEKFVTVRFGITNKKTTLEAFQEAYLKFIYSGESETQYSPYYSEITGYLWTEEKFKVGGHDILEILKNYMGQFLVMELIIHHAGEPEDQNVISKEP